MEVISVAKYNIPVAFSQWEENAEFLVKFAELFVGAKQVHRVRLVGSFHFQNIYIILLGVVPLLVTVHTYTQYTAFLLHPEKQITSFNIQLYSESGIQLYSESGIQLTVNLEFNCTVNLEFNRTASQEFNCTVNLEFNRTVNQEFNHTVNVEFNCTLNLEFNCTVNLEFNCTVNLEFNCTVKQELTVQ